jgi:hypothetical protein
VDGGVDNSLTNRLLWVDRSLDAAAVLAERACDAGVSAHEARDLPDERGLHPPHVAGSGATGARTVSRSRTA